VLKHLLTVGGLLAGLASPAFGADGDSCQTSATDWRKLTVGRMAAMWCVVLCDNKATDTDCTTYDLNSVGGIPDLVSFELHEVDIDVSGGAGDCTDGTFTVNTTSDQGLTPASENAFDIGSTTALVVAGVNRILLDTKAAPLDRYVMVDPSSLDANCTTDGVDLLMIGYEERKQ